MITDLPTAENFKSRSTGLLNLAWEVTLSIQQQNDQALSEAKRVQDELGGEDVWTWKDLDSQTESFWRRSQAELRNAHSLVNQAIELGLKGRICEVSPFLLIARDARDYPTRSDKQDTPFARFRTIDASDLLRVANSVCAERLPGSFEPFWTELRESRNVEMHSIQDAGFIKPERIVRDLLTANRFLSGNVNWTTDRHIHLFNGHRDTAYDMLYSEYNISRLLGEFQTATALLSPAECFEFFGFRKGGRAGRSYLCVICDLHSTKYERGTLPHLAQLISRARGETRLHCCACNSDFSVFRQRCPQPDCQGNVISSGPEFGGQCLTCERFMRDA